MEISKKERKAITFSMKAVKISKITTYILNELTSTNSYLGMLNDELLGASPLEYQKSKFAKSYRDMRRLVRKAIMLSDLMKRYCCKNKGSTDYQQYKMLIRSNKMYSALENIYAYSCELLFRAKLSNSNGTIYSLSHICYKIKRSCDDARGLTSLCFNNGDKF